MAPHPLVALFGDDFQQATRRCVSCSLCRGFCPAFPALYELLAREQRSGQITSAGDCREVVDLCWLCGRCELRCPGNLRFARRMVRAKAQLAAEQGLSLSDRTLSIPQVIGQWGTYLAPLSNHLPKNGLFRAVLERVIGLDRRATGPTFARTPFRRRLERGASSDEQRNTQYAARESTLKIPNRRVAFFVGCHTDFYDTAVGEAAVTVLERNNVEVIAPPYRCCGMPQLAIGDEVRAAESARRNIESWSRLVAEGYEVVTTCSTCALMLRQMYPELWPSEESRLLAAHSHDLFSYLHDLGVRSVGRGGVGGRGLRPTASGGERGARNDVPRTTHHATQNPKLSVLYHYSCHARHQRYGYNVVDLLRSIPGLEVDFAPAACCGQGGSHGFKARAYDSSLEQGAELLRQLTEHAPDIVVTDCPMCKHRITTTSALTVCHPVELLSAAYDDERNFGMANQT